ncbi:hypothetical protein B0H19DRAFT_1375889 [Mycena capillaripes]|nr:hypothetical protein B0H19DRAFT_1375889 [Mycena capillaripes]
MAARRSTSPQRRVDDVGLRSRLDAYLVTGFATKDWLSNMILAVKTVAAGAEFIPAPYIRAAFGTVIILLETVDKMRKNRDDVKNLCASIVEIVFLLQNGISTHDQLVNPHLMGLCEDFISFLHILQNGLEKLIQTQAGFRGRFKELLRATTIGDQIERYRIRINELRSNFLLVATIDTNVTVARIQKSVFAPQETRQSSQFRHVALGDINLLYENAMNNKVHRIKIFTARISGETSTMTVAKYEDEDEKWKHDLALYSRLR